MNISGVWMWPQSILVRGAQKTVSWCNRAGITDIFFLTKGLKGETAYPSEIALACSSRDLLCELLTEAHAAGIRVHAWFTSACDNTYKQLHPESGRCHYTRGKDRELISLTDAGYLSYMEKILRELCSKYEIDGVHLDYIRYNHLIYGWAEEDLARYAAAGADPSKLRQLIEKTFLSEDKDPEHIFNAYRAGDKSAHALARVRRNDVIAFASALTSLVRSEKKNAIISAALMPEGAYDDTAFADLHYGQNYEDAAKLYDYVVPMAYSRAYKKDAPWVRSIADGSMRRGLRTVVGIHAYDGGTAQSIRDDLDGLTGAPIDGICLFREGAYAYAFSDGQTAQIVNPTGHIISSAVIEGERASHTVSLNTAPGEEASIPLQFAPESIRLFSGPQEICVYLTK